MLYSSTTPSAKRAAFRQALAGTELLRFPGAFNPLSGRLVQRHGFEGVYVSGAVLSADLGLPDVGLTTLTEVAGRSAQIARSPTCPSSWTPTRGSVNPSTSPAPCRSWRTPASPACTSRTR